MSYRRLAPIRVDYDEQAVASLGEALATIATLDVSNVDRIFVEVAVIDNDLDQFEIHARPSSNGSYHQIYSTAGDYTSPTGVLVGTSEDLTSLGAGTTGWFVMDTSGFDSVQLKAASSAAGGSGVTVNAGGD